MTSDAAGVGDRVTAELRGPDGKLRQPVDDTPAEVRHRPDSATDETRTVETIEER